MNLTDLYKIISQRATRTGQCDRCGYSPLALWFDPGPRTMDEPNSYYCLHCWTQIIHDLPPKGPKTSTLTQR